MMRNIAVILGLVCAPLVADDRDVEEKKAKLRLEFADRVLADAADNFKEREKLFEAGGISKAELLKFRIAHEEARAGYGVRVLEMDEVKATGRAPNRAITAPKAGDRDFVMERLQLERRVAIMQADFASQMYERARLLAKRSAVSMGEVLEREAHMGVAKLVVERTNTVASIRARFLDTAGAERAELDVSLADATFRMRRSAVLLAVLKDRLEGVKAELEAGTATQMAYRDVEREVMRVGLEGEIAKIDMAQIKKKLGD